MTPYAGASKDFVDTWREEQVLRDPRFYSGVGWGADMNGLGHQGEPRNGPNPVTYPFKNFDGTVTVGKQRSGQRVYDINVDGVAHYGLYPDWVEDLRKQAGAGDRPRPRARLRGLPADVGARRRHQDRLPPGSRTPHAHGARGRPAWREPRVAAAARRPAEVARGAGVELLRRAGRAMTAALTPGGRVALVASTSPGHKARGVRTGMKAKRVKGGQGVRARGAGARPGFVYGVRGGRVRYVAVATGSAVTEPHGAAAVSAARASPVAPANVNCGWVGSG